MQLVTVLKPTHAPRGESQSCLCGQPCIAEAWGSWRWSMSKGLVQEDLLPRWPRRRELSTTVSIGWTEWGTCPDYDALADGTWGDATFFKKQLK